MSKKELTLRCLIPVRPILIVGANVAGKANFFEVGGGGPVSADPPMVAVPIRHERYTLRGILENRTFSVNIPSVEMAKEADYCGIASGLKTDKASDCKFKVFYGKVATAPMIEQFPVNMECSVVHILSTISHSIVIGRVDGTYVSEEALSEGELDLDKLSPLMWFQDKGQYLGLGKIVGKSSSIGNELKTR